MAEMTFNSDAPGNGREDDDLLDRDGFAEAICDLVTKVKPPFTVVVYGSWGQGKTTFMQRVAVMLGDEGYGADEGRTGDISVGFSPFIPSYGLFISKTQSGQKCHVELYPHLTDEANPRFLLDVKTAPYWFPYFSRQFDLMWDACKKTKL